MFILMNLTGTSVYLKVWNYKQKFGGQKHQHKIRRSETNIYHVIVCDLP